MISATEGEVFFQSIKEGLFLCFIQTIQHPQIWKEVHYIIQQVMQ